MLVKINLAGGCFFGGVQKLFSDAALQNPLSLLPKKIIEKHCVCIYKTTHADSLVNTFNLSFRSCPNSHPWSYPLALPVILRVMSSVPLSRKGFQPYPFSLCCKGTLLFGGHSKAGVVANWDSAWMSENWLLLCFFWLPKRCRLRWILGYIQKINFTHPSSVYINPIFTSKVK